MKVSKLHPRQQERFELWAEVGHLHALCEITLGPGHDITIELQSALDEEHRGDDPPKLAKLRKARQAFYALPVEVQRRALNGWSPDPDRRCEQDVIDAMGSMTLRRVLSINPAMGAMSETSTIFGSHMLAVVQSTAPLHVLVTEGSSQREVLDALRAIAEAVCTRWHVLIDEEQASKVTGAFSEGRR